MSTGLQTPAQEVWRPYVDRPLLTPAMAREHELPDTIELTPLRDYLSALVSTRTAPVHTAVAFNAVYFGYNIALKGYVDSPLDPDAFPTVTLGERIDALPVGAMVRIATGSHPLYAEIVYKEGRHREIGPEGDVPGWVSGAPAGAAGPGRPSKEPVRRELLVPDPHAFGEALSLTAAQLNRLCSHEKWINNDGHVLVDASYPSTQAAQQDELAAYADYLLSVGRDQLLSPLVPVSLVDLAGSDEPARLRHALTSLLAMVEHVLANSDTLRMWRHYAMTRATLAAHWRSRGPLGVDDLRALASSLEHSAALPTQRRYASLTSRTVYTAIGPRLQRLPGAAPLLSGTGYATAVCQTNLALAGVVSGESDHGRFPNGTRVTLDDAFEGGGIWRSHYPGDDEEDDDPLTPRGRGWRATAEPTSSVATLELTGAPASDPSDAPPSHPVDEPLSDDSSLGPGQLLRISDSEIQWRTTLRLAHLIEGYLPLRPLIAENLRDLGGNRSFIRLELSHPGGELDDSEAVQDTEPELGDGTGRLLGIEWPLDFFPGLELQLQWPCGGRVVRATTIQLETPVTVDGRVIEHRYDPAVLTREGAPGSSRTRDSSAGLSPEQLVMRAVRRCGLLTVDGHALLDRASLSEVVYGDPPAAAQIAALEDAVDALLSNGRLYQATGSRGHDGIPCYPARPGDPGIDLIGYTPGPVATPPAPGASRGAPQQPKPPIALQYVPGHLRRLLPGSTPSDAQRAAFREHCRRLGKADGWELPPGYTFVTQHTRGS